jgi:hypothetical protein
MGERRRGRGLRGEMAQTLYAQTNKQKKKKLIISLKIYLSEKKGWWSGSRCRP